MPRQRKAALEQENAELRKALEAKHAVENVTTVLSTTEVPVMVPIKNYGGVAIFYQYQYRGQNKELKLETSGPRMTDAIPFEIWEELRRNSRLVDEGYIARTDVPTDNPNVVENIEQLVSSLNEKKFKARLNKIVNPNVLMMFVSYLEPLKNKSGKLLAAQKAVRDRVKELTGSTIVDDEE